MSPQPTRLVLSLMKLPTREALRCKGFELRRSFARADECLCYLCRQSFVQFEVWATDDLEDEEKWEVMEWLLQAGLPGLIAIFGMVHPSESVELLRHEFCECMRSTCKAFGEACRTAAMGCMRMPSQTCLALRSMCADGGSE